MKAATYEHSGRETNIQFQSTPPVKAATKRRFKCLLPLPISIHAAREGGDGYIEFIRRKGEISIHAAREGGDGAYCCCGHAASNFNPRRP